MFINTNLLQAYVCSSTDVHSGRKYVLYQMVICCLFSPHLSDIIASDVACFGGLLFSALCQRCVCVCVCMALAWGRYLLAFIEKVISLLWSFMPITV